MRINTLLLAAICLMASATAVAQERGINLWSGKPPGSEDWTQAEITYASSVDTPGSPKQQPRRIRNVAVPSITIFLPKRGKANGSSVLVCPGGGFRFLEWDTQGTQIGRWLVENGIAAFVLKYRLVPTPAAEDEYNREFKEFYSGLSHEIQMNGPPERLSDFLDDAQTRHVKPLAIADAKQALKLIREHAAEWNLSADRVGVLGLLAGAFVAMGTVLDSDAASRPNFVAAIYGGELAGRAVPPHAPPLFIVVCADSVFFARMSERLYFDWHNAGRSAELHVFATGGDSPPVDKWTGLFRNWLEGLSFTTH